MKFTAQQIATQLKGSIDGDPQIVVSELSKIEEAQSGSLSFLANPKYTPYIYKTNASVVIVNQDFESDQQIKPTLIRVENAYQAFSELLEYYQTVKNKREGVHPSAKIAQDIELPSGAYIGPNVIIEENCVLGKNIKIFPNVYIASNVIIGDHCTIHSGAQILSDTVIGDYCNIHSGVVLGSDGFGFAPQENGTYKKVPQTGNVVLEDHVDVGAMSTIDKATLGSTLIRKGVKLDNQIQIAHNVEIGENTVIAAQTGIAGSAKIGQNCIIGGQVGVAGHISIGDNVQIQGQTGVTSNIEDNMKLQGTPAVDYFSYSKSYVHFKNLPKLVKQINQIEKKQKS
jgi:UDP-3-O-[3-hydroxymyristoyl] glucosamine N-acyltransferase